ncbi:MAG TPA: Hpt domain-containing protein [Dyella sp.]|uniref:Hpt domain-containing protein n=1 Tax=Dyella sp. TaxID=1869338 RepID=UPI002C7B27ED|nr:Hpt domain-containing protein [Dyella sp.]HUB91820.1 Hpt domain-containing protein [Dyella sp.]
MCPHPTHPGPFACSEEVRKIFVSSCEADLRAILSAWRAQNKNELLTRLHALKGALIVFGEGQAAALCERLEEDLRGHAVAACEGALRQLDRAMRRLIDSYR